jgi:16S rRNA (cytosine(967)-C(5))-methyltransferase
MNHPFREHHLFQILDLYRTAHLPLDALLSRYFRIHKAVGSKDRRYISETIYGMIRWQGLLDHLCDKPVSWQKRYALFQHFNPQDYIHSTSIPSHIRSSFPKSFFQSLSETFGEEKALELCMICNTEAPTTVRINTLKTTREALLNGWKNLYKVRPTQHSQEGIIFNHRTNFFAMPEFKAGNFEIQDEGSQLIAQLIEVKEGQQVLDYCAGAGGKTLAFAPRMQNTGQIYLHDIRSHPLEEAKKRLKRAGIQNAQILFNDDPKKGKLKHKMDWVLVDAPCSGSGTLRRNPDMKWRFEKEMIPRLVQEQREIFEQALSFLHPQGTIVYATCSLFPEENEEQAAFFEKEFHLKPTKKPFSCLPELGGMDGFFGASFQRA